MGCNEITDPQVSLHQDYNELIVVYNGIGINKLKQPRDSSVTQRTFNLVILLTSLLSAIDGLVTLEYTLTW